MLAKFGDFLYRRRIAVLCVTMAVVIGAIIFSQSLFRVLNTGAIRAENSESFQATQLLRGKLGDFGLDVIVLLRSDTLSATDPIFTQAATSLFSKLEGRPEVDSLISYYGTQSPDFISRDGHETFAVLRLKGHDFATKRSEYTSLKPELSSQTLQVKIGGTIPIAIATVEQSNNDLKRAETITFPLLLLLLLVVFGGIVAAGLPLFIGVIVILVSFAVLYGFSTVTDISVYVINVVIMLGLGLAIDYSLFILSRFREELSRNQQNGRTALERTMATAGRTVIFSALTVSTSLLSLLFFPVNFMRNMSLAAIVATLMAMLVSLIFLPVLLALLGPRVNALSLRRFLRSRRSVATNTNTRQQQGVWYRLSEMVMRRPVPVVLILTLVLITLAIPFFHIKLEVLDIRALPADDEARVVFERLRQDFARQGNAQFTIAIKTQGSALSPENLASLDNYVRSIQALPGVVHVQSLVTINPSLNLSAYQRLYAHPERNSQIAAIASNLAKDDVTKVTVAIEPVDHSSEATTLVKQIRALQAPGGLIALVDGVTPQEIDLLDGVYATLPVALLVIFASIFVLLFLMTGSLIMPLKAIILNMLSLSATFGSLVWIFQDGHLQELLQFQLLGSIEATQPIFIFALAFGLSMDYEVFVLSRIKERFDETGDNRLAVSSGIQSTGGLITSAALLMAVVLGGFGLARSLTIQQVGVGLTIAVIMDATLIRMLLLPATMRLLGTFNWWAPAPLRWLWQYIGLKETDVMPVPALQAQGDLAFVASGVRNEILTEKQERTDSHSKPVTSSLLLSVDDGRVAREHSVISTRGTNGEEIMGPDMLLWCYPEKSVVNGCLLAVECNQFCVLKVRGAILKVYETGQYVIQMPDTPLFGSVQLTFNGEPIPLEYEAFYINRAKLLIKASGVALVRETVEVDYSVDYYIHVATREDAVQLVQYGPYWSHPPGQARGLRIEDINTYVRPVIERTLRQRIQITTLGPVILGLAPNQTPQPHNISQLVQEKLRQFLSTYGIIVDEVNVWVTPRDEHMKILLSLRALGLSELDALHHYKNITNDLANQRSNEQKEYYLEEIAAIQAKLERTRAHFDQTLDAYSKRLQELAHVISSEVQASVPALDTRTHGLLSRQGNEMSKSRHTLL